ncbi:MAG: hypothetical protein EOP88_22995 [Verrucomicrobiaceae bacterium]|nr:MAG: hypothetical protein EOP88_22995 [Verrucomicrobiaceae bacterium]
MKKPDILQFQTEVERGTGALYRDYHVNGRRLADLVDTRGHISPFGWTTEDYQEQFRRQLLLEEEPEQDPDRIPLFVCHICADYLCGYFSTLITCEDDRIIWSDLRMGHIDYPPPDNISTYVLQPEDSRRWLRFSFDADEYRAAIEKGTRNP